MVTALLKKSVVQILLLGAVLKTKVFSGDFSVRKSAAFNMKYGVMVIIQAKNKIIGILAGKTGISLDQIRRVLLEI